MSLISFFFDWNQGFNFLLILSIAIEVLKEKAGFIANPPLAVLR